MFSWFRQKAVVVKSSRRAYRPGADRLESREVLSTITTAAATAARAFPGFYNNATLATAQQFRGFQTNATFGNILTAGMQSASFYRTPVTLASSGRQTVNMNGVTRSAIFAPPAQTVTTAVSNTASTARTATTAANTSRTNLPRLGGFNSNINPVAASTGFSSAIPLSFTGSNNPTLTNSSGVTNGLSFTNGLGFSSLNNQFFTGNTASNGLAFTNGLGSTFPSAGSNAASNGLAFTNGSGFSVPAQQVATSSNAASTGLAFTNGLGGTLPAAFNSLFSSTNNGLAFTSGLGFTNPSSNPFLRGSTNFSSGSTAFSNPGLVNSPFMTGGTGFMI